MKQSYKIISLILAVLLSFSASFSVIHAEGEKEESAAEYIQHYKIGRYYSDGQYYYYPTTTSYNILKEETYRLYPEDLALEGSILEPYLGKEAPYEKIDISSKKNSLLQFTSGDRIIENYAPVCFVGGKKFGIELDIKASKLAELLINYPSKIHDGDKDAYVAEYGKDYVIEISGLNVKKTLKKAAYDETRSIYGNGEEMVLASTLLSFDNISRRISGPLSLRIYAWWDAEPRPIHSDFMEEQIAFLQQFPTVEDYEEYFKNDPDSNYQSFCNKRYTSYYNFDSNEEAEAKLTEQQAVGYIYYEKFTGGLLTLEELQAGKRFEIRKYYEFVYPYTYGQIYDVWFAEMKNWDGHWKHFVIEGDTELYHDGKLGIYHGNYGNFDCKIDERDYHHENTYKYTISKSGDYVITIRGKNDFTGEIVQRVHVDVEKGKIQKYFTDVDDPSKYFYDSVYWAYDNGITTGTSATKFSPNDGCTRAQVVTFLWRTMGCPEPSIENPFADVSEDKFFYKAVLWAYENGITTGTSATAFSPNGSCTREQIVTFLYRTASLNGEPGYIAKDMTFNDVSEDKYFYEPVRWAYSTGITTGVNATTFGVGSTCSRAMVVTFLKRYSNFYPD